MHKRTAIIIIFTIVILSTLFLNISYHRKKIANNTNSQLKNISSNNKCNIESILPKNPENDWKTYQNNDYCYSFQYPKTWLLLESLEHIGPYVAVSDNQENLNSEKPKVKIATMSMEEFAIYSTSINQSKDLNIKNIWIGPRPAQRISGAVNYKDYLDTIIIPEEDNNMYIVISYHGDSNNEIDKSTGSKILESFVAN